MYYSYSCPKCGQVISEWEGNAEGSWDANYKIEDLVKQHYAQMHAEEPMPMTDQELLDSVKSGMKSSDEKPY